MFYVGDVYMAHLSKEEGLIVEGNWQQTYSPMFFKQRFGDQLNEFLSENNEYVMLYTSWGIAGGSTYASNMENYNTLSGTISVPNGYFVASTSTCPTAFEQTVKRVSSASS